MNTNHVTVSATAVIAATMLACTGGSTASSASATGSDGTPTGGAAAPSTVAATTGPAAAGPGGSGSLALPSQTSNGATAPASGVGTFTALMTDAPNPDVYGVYVTVTAVTVHVAGAGWLPLPLNFKNPVNLLALQGTVMKLGAVKVPPGIVTQIRLLVSSAPDANYVTLSPDQQQTAPLVVPSGYESGIKIIGPWQVEPCAETAVTLDFDGHNSIWYHPTGHQDEWILRPVIRVKGTTTTPIPCDVPDGGTGGSTSGGSSGTGSSTDGGTCSGGTTGGSTSGGSSGTGTSTDGGTTGGGNTTPVGQGGSCTLTTDCVSGLVCSSKNTCIVPVANGGSCAASVECASSNCSAGVCAPAGQTQPPTQPVGGSCSVTTECAAPSVCSGGACLVPAGSACTLTSDCVAGTSCIGGTCVLPVGASCQTATECVSASCVANSCSQGQVGSPCQLGAECLSGTCNTTTSQCTVSPASAPCTSSAGCPAGSVCDTAAGTCGPSPVMQPVGGSCTQNADCAQASCVAGTCQPGGYGSYCTTSSDCDIAAGLVCDTVAGSPMYGSCVIGGAQ